MLASPHTAPIHKASLVDPSSHHPATLQLVKVDMSRNLLEYVVDNVVDTVDYALGRPSSSSRGRSLSRHTEHAKFAQFVADVVRRAEITVPALLVSLVYIARAKPHLQIALEQWACERVFLGALIVANKYLNDSTLKNVHWALCTGVFGKRDVGRIEREFLDVLDWDLSVSEADLLAHHPAVMAVSRPRHHHRAHSPVRERPPPFSSESDDSMDADSDVSTQPSASPRTPGDVALPAPASAKHEHARAHAHLGYAPPPPGHFVVLPTPPPAHLAPLPQDAARYRPEPPRQPLPRMSSALQLLHSFPMPHLPSSRPSACRPLAAPPSSASAYARQVLA